MIKDMTSGKPYRQIISFIAPLIVGNLIQQVYLITDSALVGHFIGKQGISAIGSTSSLSGFFLNFILGICIGVAIPVSQCFGAVDKAGMRRSALNGAYIVVGSALLMTALTLPTAKKMLELIDTPANIIDDATVYIRIIFAGMLVNAVMNFAAGILRAVGGTKVILIPFVTSSLLNIALDLLFICVFSAGVAGVAVANVLSNLYFGITMLYHIVKKMPEILPRRGEFTPDYRLIRRLLSFGLPMSMQFTITSVGILLMQWSINILGSDAVTAYSVTGRIMNVFTQQMDVLGIAMTTYCGQNLGAGKISRVRTGVRHAGIIMAVLGIAGFLALNLFGKTAALLFIKKTELDIISKIGTLTLYQTLFFPFLGVVFLFRCSLQGLGCGIPAMLAGVCELFGRGVISIWLLISEKSFLIAHGEFTSEFIDRSFRIASLISPAAWVAASALLLSYYFYVIRKLGRRFPEELAGGTAGSTV